MSYTKSKTDSQELIKIKEIVDNNPKLIFDACQNKREILLWQGSNLVQLNFREIEFEKAISCIRDEIKSRTDYLDRYEDWETKNEYGIYSHEKYLQLIKSRKSIQTKPKHQRAIDQDKLNQLCDRFNVPRYMGDMFLRELKLDTSETNKLRREIASLLGLM